jgi:prepilin-type N-terminal cleavage/methylation domain-containing protein
MMKTSRTEKAFTLVELLVALVVTGVILSAVATLAYAMSSASRVSEDTLLKQAQLRQARLRIAELIRTCKLICAAPGHDVAIWQADSNNDGKINIGELVYIEAGDGLNTLRLCQFAPTDPAPITLQSLAAPTKKALLISQYSETYVPLIPECGNVQFRFFDTPLVEAAPPFTKLFSVSFSLAENGGTNRYEISGALRAWAGNLLSETGDALVSDDD